MYYGHGGGGGHMGNCGGGTFKLEVVTVCSNYGDLLRLGLGTNMPHFDNYIVVTDHDDTETHQLCRQFGARCVKTDLLCKDGHPFNKGAAINQGMGYFKFAYSWRVHLDADILLPLTFGRLLRNNTFLEQDCLYGADRFDVIGMENVQALRQAEYDFPQHTHHSGLSPVYGGAVYPKEPSASSARYISDLYGYCPIGFFQMWHASCQREYPYGGGSAAGDDVLFAASWPEMKRRVLPSVFVAHVNSHPPKWGENWYGKRGQPRIDGKPRGWKPK